MARYGASDARRLLPDHHRILFRDYREFLNGFSSSRYTLLSLPYDATGLLGSPFGAILEPPALLGLAPDFGLRILHLDDEPPQRRARGNRHDSVIAREAAARRRRSTHDLS